MAKYKKLKKQPLKFVLAEFRFSQVMEIEKYIPSLQEALRKTYPLLSKKQEQNIQIESNGISVSANDRWLFMAGDKKSVIGIHQDRLVFYTSAYSRFEQFEESCRDALEILIKIVDPSLILRIGLRYSDLVIIDGKETIIQLVDSNFAFPESVSSLGDGLHQRCETFIKTKSGVLAIRTLYGHNNLTCLQDIQGIPVEIEQEGAASERMILDFDHFWEPADTTVKFKINDILKILGAMHKDSRKAFWEITTEYARAEKWA